MKKYKKETDFLLFDKYAAIDIDKSKQWNIKIDIGDILASFMNKNLFRGKSIAVNLFAYKYLTEECKLI